MVSKCVHAHIKVEVGLNARVGLSERSRGMASQTPVQMESLGTRRREGKQGVCYPERANQRIAQVGASATITARAFVTGQNRTNSWQAHW